jgi:hypothetical protein
MGPITPSPHLALLSRWALVVALAALAARIGTPAGALPGPLQALAQASAVALFAALMAPRPGAGSPPGQSATAVLGWAAGAALASVILLIPPVRSLTDVGTVAMLAMGVGVLTFLAGSLLVGLGALLGDRRSASRIVVLLLLVLGAAPLWLGPAAELLAGRQAVVDTVVAISPLSYLGVLADVDYLKSDWFYRHTAFGGLRYAYPSVAGFTAAYLALGAAALGLRPLLARTGRRALAATVPCPSVS